MSAFSSSAVMKAVDFIFHGWPDTGKSNPSIRVLNYSDENTFKELWLAGLESDTSTVAGAPLNWSDGDGHILIIGNDPPDRIFANQPTCLSDINFRDHFTATSWLATWTVKFTPSKAEKNAGKSKRLSKIAVLDPSDANLLDGSTQPLQAILSARLPRNVQPINWNSAHQSSHSNPVHQPSAKWRTPRLIAVLAWLNKFKELFIAQPQRRKSSFLPNSPQFFAFVPRASLLINPSIISILDWFEDGKNDTREDSDQLTELLKVCLWNRLLGNPENHHSISNVVGAIALNVTNDKWLGFAFLRQLFSVLGFDLPALVRSQAPIPNKVALNRPCLLFDDFQSLWRSPLVSLIEMSAELSGNTELESPETGTLENSGIKTLVERLEAFAQKPYERRFLSMGDFGVEGSNAEVRDFILFLDLRLFGSSSKPKPEEIRMFERLYQAHLNLTAAAKHPEARSQLPWVSTIGDDVLDGLTSEKSFVAGYRKARALLPKLISMLDPTLPIVIFSSTQDGEVLRELLPHGNIITRFSKPMFRNPIGDWNEWHAAIQISFAAALKEAAAILEVRTEFLRRDKAVSAIQAGKTTVAVSNGPTGSSQGNQSKAVSVEIFWDESGQAHHSSFGIGGVILISRQNNGFDHQEFTNSLASADMLWGASLERRFSHSTQFPPQFLPKGNKLFDPAGTRADDCQVIEGHLRLIQSFCSAAGGEVFCFGLLNKKTTSDDFRSRNHPQQRYKEMMRETLELLLFHFSPVVQALNDGAWLAVDAATWSPEWNSRSWGVLDDAMKNFGVQAETDTHRYQAFRWPDLLPLLLETADRSGLACPWRNKIKRARAVQLVDFTAGENRDITGALKNMVLCPPLQIHYLADWIAHICTHHRNQIEQLPTLSAWLKKGWLEQSDNFLEEALKSTRYWRQGRDREALKVFPDRLLVPDPAWPYGMQPVFAEECGAWHQKISGEKLTYVNRTW